MYLGIKVIYLFIILSFRSNKIGESHFYAYLRPCDQCASCGGADARTEAVYMGFYLV